MNRQLTRHIMGDWEASTMKSPPRARFQGGGGGLKRTGMHESRTLSTCSELTPF